jgi:hypothetical protein
MNGTLRGEQIQSKCSTPENDVIGRKKWEEIVCSACVCSACVCSACVCSACVLTRPLFTMNVLLLPGGLDGLVGFADFADGYYTTIDHQNVQDSNPRPCTTTPPLTTKSQRFEPTTMHYTTIDPKFKDSNPRPCTTPRSTGPQKSIRNYDHELTTIDPQKSKTRTHGHALHHH